MVDHVLDPIDGSDEAFTALAYSFVTFPDATHITLHVINPTKKRYEGPGYDEGWLSNAKDEAVEIHDTAREMAERRGITLEETATRRGRPAEEILKFVGENDVDQISVGSKGRSSLDTVFVGSVAKTVTRRSPTTVTVVRSVDDDDPTQPEQVLVAVDGSERAYEALEFALQEFSTATITALYVIDPSEVFGTTADADSTLETVRQRADTLGSTIQTESERGDPARTIAEYAVDGGFNHLVVGRSGRSGWPRLLLGSVAESLVLRAPVPVTVVS
ncbi:universal stress protein [Natronosalvus amylolyticus]|uniref:universal stress protein n=1 Tax=Natronosalvus amylolyticus TaxID=2961994 RepID=UPI0020C9D96D|nr:universal stress protein [Natronosalvus amylolyticus]